MPCWTTLSSSTGSMLPPEMTATTGGANAAGSASTAATAATPAGSTTSLARSRQKSSARERSSSVTVRTSSTRPRTWANVRSPGEATAIPSAIVDMLGSATGRPAARDPGNAAAASAWTATTLTSGRRALTAAAIPETSPPPPVQTTTVATSGHWSSTSRPTVPCPAITSGWSKGWMKTEPGGLGVLGGRHQRLGQGLPEHPDLRPVGAGGRHLGQRRGLGHEDGGAGAEQPGGQGDPLRVVAGAGGHHSAGPLLVGQPGDPRVRPADLEGAGALQVLALEPHRAAHPVGQAARVVQRRVADDVLEQGSGRLDVGTADEGGLRNRHGVIIAAPPDASPSYRG